MAQEPCRADNPRQVKRNLCALLLDVISYWVGAAFTDPMTVLLLLMHRLGATPTILGLCIALRFAAQYGVQVFVAYIMHGKPQQKPFLVWAVGLSRLPMVALPFVIFHARTPRSSAVALWVTIGVLALVGLGEGLGAIPWTEIVARAFPTITRGRFLTAAQTSAGILNILIAWLLVTRTLSLPYPLNYTVLVGLSACMFQLSTVGLLLIDEPPVPTAGPAPAERPPLREYLAELPKMIRADKTFARLVTIQLFVNSGWAALPFYVTYATHRFHLADNWAGSYQLLSAISVALLMPLWAYLSEKHNPASAVRGVAFVCMITPVIALTVGSFSQWHFGLVFLLTGGSLTAGGIWVVMQHFLLTHTEEGERPKYVALLNLLNLPSALFPLLGSALVVHAQAGDRFIMIGKVPVLLVLTAITVSIGFFLSLRLSSADSEGISGPPGSIGDGPHNPAPGYPPGGPSLIEESTVTRPHPAVVTVEQDSLTA
jgi:MFS family permease